jgi:hypothetical protein
MNTVAADGHFKKFLKAFPLTIVLAIASMALAGCSSTRASIAPRSPRPLASSDPTVSLQLVNRVAGHGARMRLVNGSGEAISWEGYPSTPWYRLRQCDLLGWHERDSGWFCGKGLERRELPRKSATEFNVELPRWSPLSIQAGLDYATSSSRKLTVWSAPFKP